MERLGNRSALPGQKWNIRARRVRSATLLLTLIGTVAALGCLSGPLFGSPVARADSLGTISIVVPNPQDNAVQGPVGTNVTISGSGMHANDAYQIGYASQDIGCGSGFQPFSGLSANTDGNGNFQSLTFAWPASVANVGTVYYICAQDPSNSQAQSQATFTVAAAQPPAITLTAVASSTAESGGQTPSGFYPGGHVQVNGTSFLPGGVSLVVYLTTGQIQQQSDLNSAVQLPPATGEGTTSQSDGTVSIIVQIPRSQSVGNYFIYVVSSDSQQGILPSLMAAAPISLGNAPEPTPTVTPAPTPTPKVQPTPPPPSSGPGVGKDITLFGLGGLSLALLILGVYLLASASALPRQG
jgi:hypothetical protein